MRPSTKLRIQTSCLDGYTHQIEQFLAKERPYQRHELVDEVTGVDEVDMFELGG